MATFRRSATILVALLIVGLAQSHAYKVLVFSKTAAFRHDSIPNGIQMIRELGTNSGFTVDATEDAAQFNDANLAQYAAVVWLCTTGDVLNDTQQAAFERYIRAGGGYVGIHSAADTEYAWPWYGQLMGAYFTNHPAIQTATVVVADHVHPSSTPLPEKWVRNDEWYNYAFNPRGQVHVLATLNEKTYAPGANAMGFDHPIAWCHDFDGGRAWYTGGGHTQASYTEPLFRAHVLGGIQWAAGEKFGDAGATLDVNYQKVVLDNLVSNPMELSVAPDGRVFFVERGGRVKIWRPATQSTTIAGQIPVFTQLEDGLLGITLDPGFATNNWIYLFYSPTNASEQHISRFTMNGDVLDSSSEKLLLVIPTQRQQCCHSGGSLAFGPDGNLYISAGDNTNPFESSGYTPIDERPGRSPWDSQKSAGNANDLRGKILRIRPQPNGTYTTPAGNLFAPGTPNTRPEIYIMGCRNPFRIALDQRNGWLYWGEVGPDANNADPLRGPAGHDEWNQARSAGNYGWPYFVGSNFAYVDFDFATSTSGAAFNPAAPVNNSPNNTGPANLPPARPAWIWYPYANSTDFPELNGGSGRTAMGGPTYYYNSNLVSGQKLPAYFDRTVFIYEWSRNYLKEVKLDTNGNILKINPFLPSFTFRRPMEMELGPDGALYMIEWGSNFGGDSTDAQVIRIEYTGGLRGPVAVAKANPPGGSVPLTVQFSSAGSFDPKGSPLTFVWSFFGDGATNSTAPNPTFTYNTPGNYTAQLRVFNTFGAVGVANVTVVAGNNLPVLSITSPPNGAFFDWGRVIHWKAAASDVEDGNTADGTIPCSRLMFQPFIGHNDHSHGLLQSLGCEGAFTAPSGHGSADENLFLVLDASYTDNGAPGVGSLTGRAISILQPKIKQAEFATRSNGVTLAATTDPAGGGQDVTSFGAGDWISFMPMNFSNITQVSVRYRRPGSGGTLQLRADSPSGPIVATISLAASATYTNATAPVTDSGGTHEYFFVFNGTPGLALNWIEFIGAGASVFQAPFTGVPAVIPGTIEAEDFDQGGPGYAYLDQTAANQGGAYRPSEQVDIEATGDVGGGFNVGWTSAGEWTKYTANVLTSGLYTIEVRVAAPGSGSFFHVEADSNDITGALEIPNTGDWQTWQTVTRTNVPLAAGERVFRLSLDTNGTTGTVGNYNWLRFTLVTPNEPPVITVTEPPHGTVASPGDRILLAANVTDDMDANVTVEFLVDDVVVSIDSNAPYSGRWDVTDGTQVLRVRATDSFGASATSQGRLFFVADPIIPLGSDWKYADTGNDGGLTWFSRSLDDRNWPFGPAQLGFGDGDEATVLRGTRANGSAIATYYFRRRFRVDEAFNFATIYLLRDDGASVYLNDQEIGRFNLPRGAITYLTPAVTNIFNPLFGSIDGAVDMIKVPVSLLTNGNNLLAVEIHQSSFPGSAEFDLSFDLRFAGVVYKPGSEFSISLSGNQTLLRWPDYLNDWRLEYSTDLSHWSPYIDPISMRDGYFEVRPPISAPYMFFRLQHPDF